MQGSEAGSIWLFLGRKECNYHASGVTYVVGISSFTICWGISMSLVLERSWALRMYQSAPFLTFRIQMGLSQWQVVTAQQLKSLHQLKCPGQKKERVQSQGRGHCGVRATASRLTQNAGVIRGKSLEGRGKARGSNPLTQRPDTTHTRVFF